MSKARCASLSCYVTWTHRFTSLSVFILICKMEIMNLSSQGLSSWPRQEEHIAPLSVSATSSFLFLPIWWFQWSCEYWIWFSLPFILKRLSEVRDVQMLVSRDGPPDLRPASSIPASSQRCVLSFKASTMSCLLDFSSWLSFFYPRMQNPSSNCFQASVASWGIIFPELPMLFDSIPRVLGPQSSISVLFLPLLWNFIVVTLLLPLPPCHCIIMLVHRHQATLLHCQIVFLLPDSPYGSVSTTVSWLHGYFITAKYC